ncbi:MAG: hypothetical protein SPJ16_10810, partial [Helicobacter sp.]|uniref:hypothetical protein n=1 Tax=Helicobacter sp. TaxID=218 RepID=UPI002A914CE3
MPKKPFLKKLFKKNKFNPKNTSYNKEVIDLQKHALTNPISMSEAENDIETSYTDNTSTHIVIDTSNNDIDTSITYADDTSNIPININSPADINNASDTSNTTTDTSNNPIDTSTIDNNTSNEIIDTNIIHNTDTSSTEQTSIDNNAINVIVLQNNTPELQLLTYNKNEFINTSNVENIDTNNIHNTDT